MALLANLAATISRVLPGAFTDGSANQAIRGWRYGEVPTVGLLRKQSSLVEEGSYRIAASRTAILAGAEATLVATTPFITIYNGNAVGGANIVLDYINLGRATAVGTWASGGVNEQIAITVDNGNLYTSGGTDFTALVVNPNMGMASSATGAIIKVGALTVPAATASVRNVSTLRTLHQAVSTTVCGVIGEEMRLNFGGVESGSNGQVAVVTLASFMSVAMPPLVVAPGTTATIHYIMNGTTPSAPSSFLTEIAYYER